jgi:predicted dehydrogenase
MEFPNGATGSFVTTTADAPGTNRLEITTSRGRMICEHDKLIVSRFVEGDLQDYLNTAPEAFAKPKATDEVFEQCPEKNTQHVGILNNFSNAILGKEKLYVDGREGINCVQLMDAMLLSTFKDKTVTLPIDDDEYFEELSRRIASSSIKEGGDKLIDNTSSFGGTK